MLVALARHDVHPLPPPLRPRPVMPMLDVEPLSFAPPQRFHLEPAPLPPPSASFAQPADGPITSPFGMRMHPLQHQLRFHAGIDIGARRGAPVHAVQAGVVSSATFHSGYGLMVVLDHDGGVQTLYAHLDSVTVHLGEAVAAGQQIGVVGATGRVTGPHLHYERRVAGVAVDPRA